MMSLQKTKHKIKIVAATLKNPGILNIFEKMNKTFTTSVITLESSSILNFTNIPSLNFYLYKDHPELPGYINDIEKNLYDADLIIGFDTTNIASLQACRYAKQEQKPFIAVVNEYRTNIYQNYENIKSMQKEILEHADQIWISSELSRSMLKGKNILESKISKIIYSIDENFYKFSSQKKHQFRQHVKLDENVFLAIVYDDFGEHVNAITILLALHKLKTISPNLLENFKLLFIGNGPLVKDIKYKAYDLNLSHNILFMHELPLNIINDLYSASDMIIHLNTNNSYAHDAYPFFVLEALECGVYPVVSHLSPIAELIDSSLGTIIIDESYIYLASAFKEILQKRQIILDNKQQRALKLIEKTNNKTNIKLLINLIKSLIQNNTKQTHKTHYEEHIEQIKLLIQKGALQDSLNLLQEIITQDIPFSDLKAQIFYLKGKVYEMLNQWDEAISNYENSLHLNPNNDKIYEALGYISYKTHSEWESKKFFKKAISLNNQNTQAMIGLALIYEKELKPALSLFWLEKCLNINKNDNNAISMLTQICLNKQTPAQLAIEILERLIDNLGDIPQFILTLGQLYCYNGNLDEGQKLINQAMLTQLSPNNKASNN